PSTEYISRVSSVFKASGGDLKKVVRAILLDQELWSDIIQGTGTKIKEPYLTFTAMLRAFNVEPPTQWTSGKTVIRVTRNKYYMGHNTLYGTFGQAPTMAPNVFNFYQDDFIPNDFKSLELVAPEIYIKTMPNTISYNNWLIDILNLERDYILQRYTSIDAYFAGETKEGQPKLLLNIPEAYESVLNVLNSYEDIPKHTDKMLHVEVYKLIAGEITDWLSIRLLGEKLPSETRDIIVTHFAQTAKMEVGKERFGTPKRQLYERLIMPITRAIVASDHYSVQ
ncbi:MAG: DUF1800 family protein, partial [Campylobacterota bacterium]|nr:DUF1800 family protein [Campylobacterota bacterium]